MVLALVVVPKMKTVSFGDKVYKVSLTLAFHRTETVELCYNQVATCRVIPPTHQPSEKRYG